LLPYRNHDLQAACLSALSVSPQSCLAFAAKHTWEASARAFVENIRQVRHFGPEGEAIQFAVKAPHLIA
jgi:hypothetical protein